MGFNEETGRQQSRDKREFFYETVNIYLPRDKIFVPYNEKGENDLESRRVESSEKCTEKIVLFGTIEFLGIYGHEVR